MNKLILRGRLFFVGALLLGALSVSCQRSDMQREEELAAEFFIQSELIGYGEQSPYASTFGVSRVAGQSAQAISPRASGSWGQVDSTIGVWHTSTAYELPATKATESAWDMGDVMGVYIHTSATIAESNIKPGCANMEYTATSPTQWTTEVFVMPPFSGLYATAYYPYQSTIASPLAGVHSVKSDQSTQANYSLSDLMTTVSSSAIDGSNMNNVNANLRFAHLFSKFVVKFEVPAAIDGQSVEAVKSVLFPGFLTTATFDLATAGLGASSVAADITPYAAVAGATAGIMAQYEAVVAPQTLLRGSEIVSIVFTTAGGDKTVTYKVPSYTGDQDMVFASGGKYELTLEAANSLAFLTQADFSDGLSKTLPIQVKVYKGQPWSLSSAQPWCTLSFSETTGFGSLLTRSAQENDGEAVTVYVKVEGNNTAAGGWADRISTFTLKNTSSAAQVVMSVVQGYSRWEIPADPSALKANEQSVVASQFASNKPWYATIAPTTMATLSWAGGVDADRYPRTGQHLGALTALTGLKYNIQPNNTDTDRTAVVTYMPTTKEGGDDVAADQHNQTVKQLKPAITDFTHTLVAMTPSAGAFTSPAMNVAPGKGLQWMMSSADAANVTVTRGTTQTAAATDVTTTVTVNNGAAERTLHYSLNYGALSGALKTDFNIKQAAPVLNVSANKTVGPHVTTDAFQLTTASNHQGVHYKLTPSADVTSTVPAAGVEQTIIGTANLSQKVDMSFPINTGATRTHTVQVGYGASLSKTYTVTQQSSALTLNNYSATIGADGGTISTTSLTSNVPYTSKVTSINGGNVTPATGNAPPYTSQLLNVTIPPQPTTPSAARTHVFVFTPTVDHAGNSQVRTFTVTQAERPVTLTLSSYSAGTIEYTGGTYYTTVTSNCDWTVASSRAASYTPSSGGAGSTQVKITVPAHTGAVKLSPSVAIATRNLPAGFADKQVAWSSIQKECFFAHAVWGRYHYKNILGINIQVQFLFVWTNTVCRIRIYDSEKSKWFVGYYAPPAVGQAFRITLPEKNNDNNVDYITVYDSDNIPLTSFNMMSQYHVHFSYNCVNCIHETYFTPGAGTALRHISPDLKWEARSMPTVED